jgi:hypothetical protein
LDEPYGRAPDSNNVAIPLSSSTGEFLTCHKAKIVPERRMRLDCEVGETSEAGSRIGADEARIRDQSPLHARVIRT